MATASAGSVYGISRTESEIYVPELSKEQDWSAYSVDSGAAPYASEGWSPTLDYQPGETPDPQRVLRDAVVDMRPPAKANDNRWWSRLFKDRRERESVVTNEPLPFQEIKGDPRNRFARNPREVPTDEPRWTARIAPTNGSLTRPMNGGTPKQLDGNHFSMADHARVEDTTYGMVPPRSPRSTYRLDTLPWGEEVVDMPAVPDYTVDETIMVPSYVPAGRSYRLV